MRLAFVTLLAFAILALPGQVPGLSSAHAQECTGDNCPKPSGGGRDCESKKEDTVS